MKNNIPRVLQLIDSLNAGGAERVSVNLANALSETGIKSFLCATRQGGVLDDFLFKNIETLVLQKKSVFDIKAVIKLVKFIRYHDINIIHAHSSSFFTALLCKPFTGVKIVWHDHYGNAEQVEKRSAKVLKYASCCFDYVFSVNEQLEKWAKKNLFLPDEKISFLQNFAQLSLQDTMPNLPGSKETRIVCLANLRKQKDHINLLNAFKKVVEKYSQWHLLLVGQDSKDTYSSHLKQYIQKEKLEENIHILGSRSDSADILLHSEIGVLSSESEGLPVALLEYGLASLPVVCTNVGQCAKVLGNGKYGKVVPPKNSDLLAEALLLFIENSQERKAFSLNFYDRIQSEYSQKVVMEKVVSIYKGLLNV